MLSKVEQKVLDKAYSSNKAYDDLVTLCDRYGGRFAGSEENREAAEYILGLYEDNVVRLIHYLFIDERRHFAEAGCPRDHIFHDVCLLAINCDRSNFVDYVRLN